MRVVSCPAFFWREATASSGDGGVPPLGRVPYLLQRRNANAAKTALRRKMPSQSQSLAIVAKTKQATTARAGA